MSLFVAPRALIDYPAYDVNIQLGTGPDSITATLDYMVIPTLANPSTNQPPGVTDFLTALFAEIQTFGGSYDWATDYGAGVSMQTFTVTELTEAGTNVTPGS